MYHIADVVKNCKDDFYDKYSCLKPDYEKSWIEQRWEDCKSALKTAGEWCKEHWVMIVTVLVVIAIAIVAVVTFGVAIIASWFNQPGGRIQYKFDDKVIDLLINRKIKIIDYPQITLKSLAHLGTRKILEN